MNKLNTEHGKVDVDAQSLAKETWSHWAHILFAVIPPLTRYNEIPADERTAVDALVRDRDILIVVDRHLSTALGYKPGDFLLRELRLAITELIEGRDDPYLDRKLAKRLANNIRPARDKDLFINAHAAALITFYDEYKPKQKSAMAQRIVKHLKRFKVSVKSGRNYTRWEDNFLKNPTRSGGDGYERNLKLLKTLMKNKLDELHGVRVSDDQSDLQETAIEHVVEQALEHLVACNRNNESTFTDPGIE